MFDAAALTLNRAAGACERPCYLPVGCMLSPLKARNKLPINKGETDAKRILNDARKALPLDPLASLPCSYPPLASDDDTIGGLRSPVSPPFPLRSTCAYSFAIRCGLLLISLLPLLTLQSRPEFR